MSRRRAGLRRGRRPRSVLLRSPVTGALTFSVSVVGCASATDSPLTAANFARAFGRVRDPVMGSSRAELVSDVMRVTPSGLRLRIELRRPSGDLTTRLALRYACPVPPGFPVDPAGVDLTGVGSGAYNIVPLARLSSRRLARSAARLPLRA
jgi:hypothetical protein